jgi:serine/threonine-protein kinase
VNPAEEHEVRRILEKRLCTPEQVEEAQGIQRQMEQMGLRPRSVPDVLVEKGYLDASDLEEIQQEEHSVEGRDQIAGYRILELLGRGATGAVYKAKQLSLDREVALKVLDPEMGRDEDYVRRFLAEARAVARLSHTNLISGIDVGEEDGIQYLVMEYADGITLARVLRRGGALDEERALAIALQIARALDYAHRQGMVHGDVRPGNVIVTADGVAKLTDLGVARRPLVGGDAGDRSLRGTPDYVSPEQARGQADPGPLSDVYSLGAVLFHMLTGRVPFSSESREATLAKHLTETAPAVRSLAPEVSAAAEAIVQRCLQKHPSERFGGAGEFVQALDAAWQALQGQRLQLARATAPAAPAEGPSAPVLRSHRRRLR